MTTYPNDMVRDDLPTTDESMEAHPTAAAVHAIAHGLRRDMRSRPDLVEVIIHDEDAQEVHVDGEHIGTIPVGKLTVVDRLGRMWAVDVYETDDLEEYRQEREDNQVAATDAAAEALAAINEADVEAQAANYDAANEQLAAEREARSADPEAKPNRPGGRATDADGVNETDDDGNVTKVNEPGPSVGELSPHGDLVELEREGFTAADAAWLAAHADEYAEDAAENDDQPTDEEE